MGFAIILIKAGVVVDHVPIALEIIFENFLFQHNFLRSGFVFIKHQGLQFTNSQITPIARPGHVLRPLLEFLETVNVELRLDFIGHVL